MLVCVLAKSNVSDSKTSKTCDRETILKKKDKMYFLANLFYEQERLQLIRATHLKDIYFLSWNFDLNELKSILFISM